jgi:4-hydroxybenzoate polyprenyltransferase
MNTLDDKANAATESLLRRRRSPIKALLVSLRPKQWTKNLLLFSGLLFTSDEAHSSEQIVRAVAAFVVFSLLSSCVYLINDVVDVDRDKAHPKKCFRPIAAGELPVLAAIGAACVFGVFSLTCAFLLGGRFGTIALVYFLLTLAYSFSLKHIVILDVLVLASGFVLRAIAGAVVINVNISAWLILCTMMLALFLALSKRKAELLASLESGSTSSRRILTEYTGPMLDQMIVIVTSACLMSYALYTIESPAAYKHHYLMATIPFVLYGIFRYLYLAHRHDLGESPDTVLLEDRPTQINMVLFILATGLIVSHTLQRIINIFNPPQSSVAHQNLLPATAPQPRPIDPN